MKNYKEITKYDERRHTYRRVADRRVADGTTAAVAGVSPTQLRLFLSREGRVVADRRVADRRVADRRVADTTGG
jgi:hypothetical protein